MSEADDHDNDDPSGSPLLCGFFDAKPLLCTASTEERFDAKPSLGTASAEDPPSTASCGCAPGAIHGAASDTPREPRRTMWDKGDLRILPNVYLQSEEAGLSGLVASARELSENTFGEDCLSAVTKKSRWQLTLLASADRCTLYGFLVAKTINGSLAIAKLAMASEYRGMGLGKHFVEQVMKAAKKRGDVFDVSLCSLATAVKFYQRLGFKALQDLKAVVALEADVGTHQRPDQRYMQKKLRPRPHRK